MKTHFLLALLVAGITATGFAQTTDEAAINKTFYDYFKVVEKKDNDATLDYMYPKLFDIAPRSAIKKSMDDVYADTSILINFDKYYLHSVSKVLTVDGAKYALGKYSFRLLMEVKVQEGDEVYDSKNMVDALAGKYGKKNVSYDEATNTYIIVCNREMFAINDPQYPGGWKFIENKEGAKALMEKLLPEEVIKKFL